MATETANKIVITKEGNSYILDTSNDIINITRSGLTFTATRRNGDTFTFTQQDADTKNTTGSAGVSNTKLFLVGAASQSATGVETKTNTSVYIGTDNMLRSNNKVVLTEHQDISGKVDKVSGKGLSTNDFTNAYKTLLDNLNTEIILGPSQPISIPAVGSANAVVKYMNGITADFELLRWNFSESSENNPPVSLQWTTADGYFRIENLSGTTTETIQPIFGLVTKKTATDNS